MPTGIYQHKSNQGFQKGHKPTIGMQEQINKFINK